MDHLKSDALRSSPLENLRPFLNVNVYSDLSSETTHDSAKSGTIFKVSSKVTNPENSSTMIPAEVVSVTKWGSKVGGSE